MDQTLQEILILMASYTLFLVFFYIFIRVMKRYMKIMKVHKAHRLELQKRRQMMAEMKEKGELHEWMTIQQTDKDGNVHDLNVCKKTGWCPQLQHFFTMSYVRNEILNQEYKKQYKEYRNAQVELLASKFGHSTAEMEEIVESVFDIKKQFTLLWIKERNLEMQNEQQYK